MWDRKIRLEYVISKYMTFLLILLLPWYESNKFLYSVQIRSDLNFLNSQSFWNYLYSFENIDKNVIIKNKNKSEMSVYKLKI